MSYEKNMMLVTNRMTESEARKAKAYRMRKAKFFMGVLQLVLVILFVALSFFGARYLASFAERKDAKNSEKELILPTRTVIADKSENRITVTATGFIKPTNTLNITTKVSGKVIYRNENLYNGSSFKKGEKLFSLDKKPYLTALEQARANLKSAQTQYSVALANSENAVKEWLIVNETTTNITPLAAKYPQLEQAEAQLEQAKIALTDAQQNLAYTDYTMPFDGVIESASIELGQYISAGQSNGKAFAFNSLKAVVPLKVNELNILNNDKLTAEITVQDHTVTAKLSHISSYNDSNSQMRDAWFSFDSDKKIKSIYKNIGNSFLVANIESNLIKDTFKVPVSALQDNDKIYIVDSDARLQILSPDIIYKSEEMLLFKLSDTDKTLLESTERLDVVTNKMKGAVAGTKIKEIEAL